MALGSGPGASGHVRGRRRAKKRPLSEINVTPLVDVMLVLLIIFMISAPLLTVGVPLELPRTDASAVSAENEPISVSVDRAGGIYVDQDPATLDQLPPAGTFTGWRNIAYAIEWWLFAAFALFLWWRFVRDSTRHRGTDGQAAERNDVTSAP